MHTPNRGLNLRRRAAWHSSGALSMTMIVSWMGTSNESKLGEVRSILSTTGDGHTHGRVLLGLESQLGGGPRGRFGRAEIYKVGDGPGRSFCLLECALARFRSRSIIVCVCFLKFGLHSFWIQASGEGAGGVTNQHERKKNPTQIVDVYVPTYTVPCPTLIC